jgi:guanylate kinase
MSGRLFIVSAPSGVGKTTIIQAILPKWPSLRYSISSTTRSPRPNEVDGRDYHFVSKDDFLKGIGEGRFLEWAEVHGQFYGTDGRAVKDWLKAGDDALLDIDVQGARQVRCTYPMATTLFILPPSMEVLEARLANRGTESDSQLRKRLDAATHEIVQAAWYDYLIVNDDLADAVVEFESVLRAARCERQYQAHHLRLLLGRLSGF